MERAGALTSLLSSQRKEAAITQSSLLLISLWAAGPRGQPLDSFAASGPPGDPLCDQRSAGQVLRYPGGQQPEPLRGRVSRPGLGLRMSGQLQGRSPQDSLESAGETVGPQLYRSLGDSPKDTSPCSPGQGTKGHLHSRAPGACDEHRGLPASGCRLCACLSVPSLRAGSWKTQQPWSTPPRALPLSCCVAYDTTHNFSERIYPTVKWGCQHHRVAVRANETIAASF